MSGGSTARPYSLRVQLLFWLLVPLFVIGLIALADAWISARRTADEILDRVLAGSVLAIAERVVVSETGDLEVDIPYVALEMLTSSAQDRVFYRIARKNGVFITGYKALAVPEEAAGRIGDVTFGNADYQGSAIRYALYAGAASSGLESIGFHVIVAETTKARSRLARSLLLRSLARQAVLVLVAPFVVWFGVSRALRPLYELRDAIARRSPDDLRPIERRVPTEMSGVLEATNRFLDKLRGAIGALRHFTGNASHQLRTPLTVIRTRLALARRGGNRTEAERHIDEADQAVGQAERILAQLLLLARIDEASTRPRGEERTDLAALAREIVGELVPVAARNDIDLGLEIDDKAVCRGDPMLVGELLRNLIDNALRYSGTGSVVTVRVRMSGNLCMLEVEDDGPGIAIELRDKVIERFSRGNAVDAQGAGLGLSVVSEICDLYGGALELVDGAGAKGLLARVILPSACPRQD